MNFKLNQKGQADLIGNFFDLIDSQPYIIPLIFLALIYSTTLSLNLFGINFSLGGYMDSIGRSVAGAFGFVFSWELFVILAFLTVPVLFILRFGKMD